jgi:hypothetical protein
MFSNLIWQSLPLGYTSIPLGINHFYSVLLFILELWLSFWLLLSLCLMPFLCFIDLFYIKHILISVTNYYFSKFESYFSYLLVVAQRLTICILSKFMSDSRCLNYHKIWKYYFNKATFLLHILCYFLSCTLHLYIYKLNKSLL